jgi:hypothetical protein
MGQVPRNSRCHRLSRDFFPVVHLSTHPILGQVTRSHDAVLGAWEEP